MKREIWLDRVRIWACILVAAGHFFQSMVAADLMVESALYDWFMDTIYYFHVPLFFICSGYLYQRHSKVDSVSAWKASVVKKAIALGVPYFVFTLATWCLKMVFSSSVNSQNRGLFESLFQKPVSPYWYLYILFFVFVITPTFWSKRTAAIGLCCALGLKWGSIVCPGWLSVYAIRQTMANEIWFVIGMVLCAWKVRDIFSPGRSLLLGALGAMLFLAGSVTLQTMDQSDTATFGMGLLGCFATILLIWAKGESEKQPGIIDRMARYTMPVFLMHTIFAAGLRAVLMRMGVRELMIHVVLGLGISFAGPVFAAEIMKKLRLDVLYDPGKYFEAKADKRN